MTKVELTTKICNELTDTQIKLINFNIYYNEKYIDYYINYNCGEYQKCYDFLINNLEILDIKYTPKKFIKPAKKLIGIK
jgi:hypothetical protein